MFYLIEIGPENYKIMSASNTSKKCSNIIRSEVNENPNFYNNNFRTYCCLKAVFTNEFTTNELSKLERLVENILYRALSFPKDSVVFLKYVIQTGTGTEIVCLVIVCFGN